MLVLNRKVGEQIVVPQVELVFTVLEVQGDKVSIGIAAPKDLKVHRREVWERIQRNTPQPQEAVPAPVEAEFAANAMAAVH